MFLAFCACRLRFDELSDGGRGNDLPARDGGDASMFEVGSFAKIGTVSSQTLLHGLGTSPRALVLWTSGHAALDFSTSARFAIGFTDQDRTSRAIAMFSQDNMARISDRRISLGAITLVGDNATALADASVSAWDTTTVTLDWTINDGGTETVHYVLFGGAVSSRVVGWTMPDVSGPHAIGTIGFRPEVVLHAHAMAGVMTAPPANATQAGLGLGAMTPTGQWASAVFTADGGGPTNTQRGARTDACVTAFDSMEVEIRRAAFSSMDPAGFTLDFDIVGAAGTHAFSLALGGLRAHADSFPKPDLAPAQTFAVPGPGFRPGLLLLASVHDIPRATPVAHSRFGFGAASSTYAAATSFSDTDGLVVASVDSVTRVGAAYVKLDNDAQTIDAELGPPAFEATGFSLPVTINNDAVPTLVHYVALGAP